MDDDALRRDSDTMLGTRTRLWNMSPIFFGIISIIGLTITMIIITPAFAETGNSCDFFCWLANLFSFNFDLKDHKQLIVLIIVYTSCSC